MGRAAGLEFAAFSAIPRMAAEFGGFGRFRRV
jgi:hypothetical protein